MKDDLLKQLEDLKNAYQQALPQTSDEPALAELKARFLGKKGRLTEVLQVMAKLPSPERPIIGHKANEVKEFIENSHRQALMRFQNQRIEQELSRDQFDISLPGKPIPQGHLHPVRQMSERVENIFCELGFEIHHGPEIETDYYNFESLNFPLDHPARDLQDTFYLSNGDLLRTHTSPVQIRTMETKKPPIRIIAPGAVYRCDSDATHSPMFHQIEGLWVDEYVSFADLKGVLTLFIQRLFGKDFRVRFRPSFFPFTEPSAELDMTCVFCQGNGCKICKGTGWIEVLGCGMVDPAVFKFVDVDPEKYTGFAFGIGLERLTMLKHGINDLRLFFENDVRFLGQF